MNYENKYDYTDYTLSPLYLYNADDYELKEFKIITYEEARSFVRYELKYEDLFEAKNKRAKLYIKFEKPYRIRVEDFVILTKNFIETNACVGDICAQIDSIISNSDFKGGIDFDLLKNLDNLDHLLLDEKSFLSIIFLTLLEELDNYPSIEIVKEFYEAACDYEKGFKNENDYKNNLRAFVFFHLITTMPDEGYPKRIEKFIKESFNLLKGKSLYFMDAALGITYMYGGYFGGNSKKAKHYIKKAFNKYQNPVYAEKLGDLYSDLENELSQLDFKKAFNYYSFARNSTKLPHSGLKLINSYKEGFDTAPSLYIANHIAYDLYKKYVDYALNDEFDTLFPEICMEYSYFNEKGVTLPSLPKLAFNTLLKGKICSQKRRELYPNDDDHYLETDFKILNKYFEFCYKLSISRTLNEFEDGYYISTEDSLINDLNSLFRFSYYHAHKDYVELVFYPNETSQYVIAESIGFVSFDNEIIIRLENCNNISDIKRLLQTKPDFYIKDNYLAIKKNKSYVLNVNDSNKINIEEKNSYEFFEFAKISLVLNGYNLKNKTRIIKLEGTNIEDAIEFFKDVDHKFNEGSMVSYEYYDETVNASVQKVLEFDEDQLSFSIENIPEI